MDWEPRKLTAVAVDARRAVEAERKAIGALEREGECSSWVGLSPSDRMRIVRDCRSIPTVGLYFLIDDGDAPEEKNDFARDALADVAEQFLSGLPGSENCAMVLSDSASVLHSQATKNPWTVSSGIRVLDDTSFPGLRELTRLSSLACGETLTEIGGPPDEDLLDIYDTYTVGALGPPDSPA